MLAAIEPGVVGATMLDRMRPLYPICRSITGNGVRETLRQVGQHISLTVYEIPTGTRTFDWTIPKEWNISDAYVKGPDGTRVIDFRESNLHVLNYSVPVHATMDLSELRNHLYSLPEHPDWIPYKTSYYAEQWGFCVRHKDLERLEDGPYEVRIDSTLEPGHLTYGEYFIPGETREEMLLSCHVCHPSLCNDNLSGIALCTALAEILTGCSTRLSYRFLFIPGTIGAIAWLHRNEARTGRVRHGLVVACVGDAGKVTYKRSRRGDAEVDRAASHVLSRSGAAHEILDFSPYGYDERQFCSPGFDLPVGAISRTPHARFPEYHTSADNLDFVRPECLGESLLRCLEIIHVLDGNRPYVNRNPKCEPQLGRRGLYRNLGGHVESQEIELAMLWVLNLSDGNHALLDIADRAKMDFKLIEKAAALLEKAGLIDDRPSTESKVGAGDCEGGLKA
jgi:aminopeptidase-like protein